MKEIFSYVNETKERNKQISSRSQYAVFKNIQWSNTKCKGENSVNRCCEYTILKLLKFDI